MEFTKFGVNRTFSLLTFESFAHKNVLLFWYLIFQRFLCLWEISCRIFLFCLCITPSKMLKVMKHQLRKTLETKFLSLKEREICLRDYIETGIIIRHVSSTREIFNVGNWEIVKKRTTCTSKSMHTKHMHIGKHVANWTELLWHIWCTCA